MFQRTLKQFRILIPVLAALSAAATVRAQTALTGAIQGTVTDAAGGVVLGATVELASESTALKATQETDSRARSGSYGSPRQPTIA